MGRRHTPETFLAKIDRTNPNECWVWPGARNTGGYGVVKYRGRSRVAHKLAYEMLVGPVPDGLVLDHLCRVRECVNPAHLEPVTQQENVLRGPGTWAFRNRSKSHCINGHEFAGENLYTSPEGYRQCKTCRLRNKYAYRARLRAQGKKVK